MSEEHGVGTALRTAREAQGLSIQDVGNHLRLMHRQIVAMETEDFASLGQPVFARGFVRNYARLLGLDHEALLQAMGGAIVEPVDIAQASPMVLPGPWFTSGWLIAGLLALLVLTVVPIALYAWLTGDSKEIALTPRAATVAPPVAPPVKLEPTVPVPVPEVPPAADVAGIPAPLPPPVAVEPALTRARSELHFEFAEPAWVEIKDGAGQVLQRQKNNKGSNLTVFGKPPFSLVVGNAAQVRMTHNGRPLDLTPYTDGNVARFSLEE